MDTNAPIFLNAKIHVPAVDHKYWTDPAATAGAAKRIQAVFPGWKNIKPFEGNKPIVTGVRAIATFGHTPGHTSYQLGSGSKQFIVLGDVSNIPALFVVHPEWRAAFDTDGQLAETHRRKMFNRVITDRAKLAITSACPVRAPSRRTATGTPSCQSRSEAAIDPRRMRAIGCRFDRRGAPGRRAAPFRCRLVVMAKAPVAGAVKTRLARALGVANATRFARHATAALLQRLARDPRWQTILAVTPDVAVNSHCWPRGVVRVRQGNGDLGCRMQRIVDMLPPGPVAIIGADIPSVTPAHIAPVFRRLGPYEVVFGKALDGGYWLVGMRRRPRVLRAFANVRWSSEHALSDTLASLRHATVGFIATLPDVDEATAFHAAAGLFGRRVLCHGIGATLPQKE